MIVSNYTQTLSVLADMCRTRGYDFFQLDGGTKVSKRQDLVDAFNIATAPECTLLSSLRAVSERFEQSYSYFRPRRAAWA